MKHLALSLLLLALAAPAATRAEAPTPAATIPASGRASRAEEALGLVVGLKLGAAFNSVFNSLEASWIPELEMGYCLPALKRSFEIFVGLRHAAPEGEGEDPPDPRLSGDGIARWHVTRNELAVAIGLRARLALQGGLTPYAAAGGRLYLMRTEVRGEVAGVPYGTHDETGHALGFLFALGAEYAVGPGRVLLELAANGVPLDQTVLGDTNASSLDASLGYRLFF